MKFYLFGHIIKEGSKHVNAFINFVNTTSGNLTIGMTSGGGDVGASLFILEMLNRNKDRIHLIAAGAVYSSAFDIFVGFRGYKSVLSGTMGMTHQNDTTIKITEKGYYLPEDNEVIKNQVSFSEITKDITFPVMTAAQISAYENGKEVYFTCENLRKIATKQNRGHKAKKPL